MRICLLLGALPLVLGAYEFRNGPGTSLARGRRTDNFVPIIELSEDRIHAEVGNETTSAVNPYVRDTIQNGTTPNPSNRKIFKKRQDLPAPSTGPVTCTATSPCIDGSCCGANGMCGFKAEHCKEGCRSNCDAKPMCGADADGNTQSCGLNICCSYFGWCGTKEVHCIDPEPQFGVLPCQPQYGRCEMVKPRTCDASGPAKPKRIAYYQGWNSRTRTCDQVLPKDIDTKGLTHLMYSFVGFDPSTFEIVADPADVPLFPEFVKRKTGDLQTWVAVGGWSFNDPGPTFNAFSTMVSSEANRSKFIYSLIAFMDKYGFDGADIDWEYPSEKKRGGTKADKANLVLLLKEMRQKFPSNKGISVVLAPDYWYLQGFAPGEMQQHVDHMGFMAYDLHGPWDSENALGSRIRPHTDIREIENGLKPLWYDGVDPSKIVLGLAYYGRTFTAASSDCPVMGCTFSGPGKAYGCTNFPGVLSNMEIRRIIKEKGAKPELLSGAMVKELVWDKDQWVAYDDAETIAMKTEFANKMCLGGTMIWSIDYDSNDGGWQGGSGGGSGSGSGGNNPPVIALPSESNQIPACTNPSSAFPRAAHYRCVKCSDPDVNDATKWPTQQWAAAKGDNAVEWHHAWFRTMRLNGELGSLGPAGTYVRSLSWQWNGPSQWTCAIGITGSCDQNVACGDRDNRGKTGATDNPAASLMMTQWAHIRTFYTNQHLALLAASSNIDQNIGSFASTFSPPLADGTKALKIMIDILSLGYGIFAAGAWNTLLRDTFGKDRGNQHGWNKDGSNVIVQSMLTISKDTLSAPPSPLSTQNKLSEALSAATQRFMKAIDEFVKEIFSGSEKGLDTMTEMLKDGKWLDPGFMQKSLLDNQKEIQRLLFGMLLTKAWSLTKDVQPYIIRIEKSFSNENPTKDGSTSDLSDSQISDGRVFVEGETYILINMGPCLELIPDEGNFYNCVKGGAGPIPGIKELISPPDKWGNIGKEDIVTSAVQGWKLNGGRNGYVLPQQSKHVDGQGTLSELMFENGIRTPGFFSFPICGYKEAKLAWIMVYLQNEKPCPTYPCCVYK